MSLRWYLTGQSRKRASVHCSCNAGIFFVFNGLVIFNKGLYGCPIKTECDLSTKVFQGSSEWDCDCRGVVCVDCVDCVVCVTCTRSVAPFLRHSPVPGDVWSIVSVRNSPARASWV